jgi:hypothetical protein
LNSKTSDLASFKATSGQLDARAADFFAIKANMYAQSASSICVRMAALVAIVVPAGAAETPAAPLLHAHAHNDYLHERPLLDALDHGFTSLEADVYLVDGQLLVAHTRAELKPERTLKRLYLDPLCERARQGNGRVWPGGPPLTLLVDIKADGQASYQALARLLAEYDDMVSVFDDERAETKALKVVVSGDRAREAIAADVPRYVGIDGRLSDLEADVSPDLFPLISDNWNLHFRWRGEGPFPDAERAKLRDIVRRAHDRRCRVRFWATPEKTAVWQELLAADVDLIGSDDLVGLERFLRQAKSGD